MPRAKAGGKAESDRTISFAEGSAEGLNDDSYPGNRVKTSKYTWVNFVPLNLFEQLHKFGNAYFLCISVIMYIGEKTPLFVGTIKAFSTMGVLVAMMMVTAAMALLDDIRRKEADNEINTAEASVVRKGRGKVSSKTWESVQVGDVLLIRQDEEFPADMVPFYCSGEGGNCYVSTANLDGETNLKLKTAPSATQSLLDAAGNNQEAVLCALRQLTGRIRAEAPNSNIHDFSGNLTMSSGAQESLGAKQLLLRGTVLRNTAMCLGVVVYCGPDTRMVRNSRPSPMKQSNLEHVTNKAMLIILAAQAVMALFSSICHELTKGSFTNLWYLRAEEIILPEILAYWLTFFTLYSNLMPISLYPTTEFCNAVQSYFIRNDRHMYYKEQGFNNGVGFSARARSSNLCQELGQVAYIFSDKTGTLTQNVMELKRLSIAGRVYGDVTGEDGFSGADNLQAARAGADRKPIDAFLEALAVAHTVMVSQGEEGLEYEAESPDEYALVKAAAQLGWTFLSRRGNTVVCEVASAHGRMPQQYTVLAVNEFNSTRKRMSVVVQKGNEYLLFVKGADNVMLERAQGKHQQLEKDLKVFSREGLRTLVIGSRRLNANEVAAWQTRFDEASRRTEDREGALEAVAEEIERPLEILGATAIEDKLQDEVPETIVKIRSAGIKLWVLTGDKLETARNIGFSTQVLTEEMNIQTIDEDEGVDMATAAASLASTSRLSNKALMVTGKALSGLLKDPRSKKQFLKVAESCSVLIACRVTPLQKAEMVRLVREGVRPQPVTLAVGDGANDVPMIQESQVGVGIAGREGRQSVNNSDFAIGQFKYLQRLLLVHGRWNYLRACKYTLFTFWRNMVQVLLIFYYTSISGFSGTVLFEDWVRLSFNILGSIPILAVGCFDQDVPCRTALENPGLYSAGRLGTELGRRTTFYTLIAALVHSSIIFVITIMAFPGMDLHGSGDYYTFGTTVYSCLIVDMTYRVAFLTHTHNKYTGLSILFSLLGYVFWMCFYPSQKWVAEMLEPNMYMVPYHMVRNWYFWFCILVVPLASLVVDSFLTFASRLLFPDERDKIQTAKVFMRTHSMEEQQSMLCAELGQGSSEDGSMETDEEASSSTGLSDYAESDIRQLDMTDFGQQKGTCRKVLTDWWSVVVIAMVSGTMILALGFWALAESMATAQLVIEYQPGGWGRRPLWDWNAWQSTASERFRKDCTGECNFEVRVPETMRPPILVFYAIAPFYQNFNDYLKSEITKELSGDAVSEGLRESKCWWQSTRELSNGSQIAPCGMKATSLFNDSLSIAGVPIEKSDVAWRSDAMRYNNPSDYPTRPDTSWLYERYPRTVSEPDGVESGAFCAWMRPAALPRVWNRYGWIRTALPQNATLQVSISSVFPAREIGAYKMFVLTELGSLGGRHNSFGIVLIICGVCCYVFAAATCAMEHLYGERSYQE